MTSVVKKDDAVSPVIGTILLVAITVVLVAIVAAVVMGMAGGQQAAKDVGFTVTTSSDTAKYYAVFTPYGGKDLGNVKTVTIVNVDDTAKPLATDTAVSFKVGVPEKVELTTANVAAGPYKVNIVGTFADGSESVIYTGTINVPALTT